MRVGLELLERRRSVRRFRPCPPPRALLLELVEAAATAPSASNRQPWRFLVVTDRVLLARMAAEIDAAVDRIAAHADPALSGQLRAYAASFSRPAHAPAVIAPLHRPVELLSPMLDDATGEDDRRLAADLEREAGLVSTAMAVENLLLAAPALGLGAVVATGALLARPALEALLGVEAPWRMLGLVAVGVPDEAPEPTPRKPAVRIARFVPEEEE